MGKKKPCGALSQPPHSNKKRSESSDANDTWL